MIVPTSVIGDCRRLLSYDVTSSTYVCTCAQKRSPTMRPLILPALVAALSAALVALSPADPRPREVLR